MVMCSTRSLRRLTPLVIGIVLEALNVISYFTVITESVQGSWSSNTQTDVPDMGKCVFLVVR